MLPSQIDDSEQKKTLTRTKKKEKKRKKKGDLICPLPSC